MTNFSNRILKTLSPDRCRVCLQNFQPLTENDARRPGRKICWYSNAADGVLKWKANTDCTTNMYHRRPTHLKLLPVKL